MTKFYVWGEYGVVASDYVGEIRLAKTAANARKNFIRDVKREYPTLWKRIGDHNVYVRKVYE